MVNGGIVNGYGKCLNVSIKIFFFSLLVGVIFCWEITGYNPWVLPYGISTNLPCNIIGTGNRFSWQVMAKDFSHYLC